MVRFRNRYGAGPLHLAAGLVCLGVAGLAAWHWFDAGAGDGKRILVWFLGAIVVHDLVFVPAYSLADRLLSRRSAARDRARPAIWRAHVRVPAILSGLLGLVFAPLIFRFSHGDYGDASGLSASVYLDRWLIASAVLFGISAAVFLARTGRR
jgi:hypothetical protein